VSLENWDEVWRRNQFLCAGLARRDPARRILFVGLPHNLSYALRCGGLKKAMRMAFSFSAKKHEINPEFPNLTLFRPVKLAPNSLGIGRLINEAIFRSQVRRMARQLQFGTDTILWLNDHAAVHLVDRLPAKSVVYDVTDDWTKLSQSTALTELVRRQDARLCRRADAVIVCSQNLYDQKKKLSQHVHLIPNGVHIEHYETVLEPMGGAAVPETARWRRPVLGYTGTIHPDRVDVALVRELARRFAGGTIALVGPSQLNESDQALLRAEGNVILTGPVPYERVPDYMRSFDVCITPHRMTPFTESLNPIKLWEYLATGKPIVSTDVAGFRDYPGLIHIARDAERFINGVREALAEDEGLRDQRRQIARANSWTTRLNSVEAILTSCPDPMPPVGVNHAAAA
jgi:glycosyltransferase involved in cell wall biosynthesis